MFSRGGGGGNDRRAGPEYLSRSFWKGGSVIEHLLIYLPDRQPTTRQCSARSFPRSASRSRNFQSTLSFSKKTAEWPSWRRSSAKSSVSISDSVCSMSEGRLVRVSCSVSWSIPLLSSYAPFFASNSAVSPLSWDSQVQYIFYS